MIHTKSFPDGTLASYPKRFAGYSAAHYRVRLRETGLVDAQKRYAEARVEVQVASVLMHAWTEVEHDLVYKPYQGALSEDEYAILDELNGMVMAGEIALERLERAGDQRVAVRGRQFANHYDLAAHLISALRGLAEADALQEGLGRVDLLWQMLRELGLATPEKLDRYLSALHPDLDRRPVAEQVIDQLLSEDPDRYSMYEALRASSSGETAGPEAVPPAVAEDHEAMGLFMTAWIELERLVRDLTPREERERAPARGGSAGGRHGAGVHPRGAAGRATGARLTRRCCGRLPSLAWLGLALPQNADTLARPQIPLTQF